MLRCTQLQIKPLEELFATDSEIDMVFNKYCVTNKIHLYGVRCAFLHLYGEEFSAEEVRDLMCGDSCRKLISKSLEEFRILMKTYESNDNFQQKMALKLFTAFDTKRRGSVSQIDFKNLLVQFAPKLARKHSDRLFSALDTFAVGKIAASKFTPTSARTDLSVGPSP